MSGPIHLDPQDPRTWPALRVWADTLSEAGDTTAAAAILERIEACAGPGGSAPLSGGAIDGAQWTCACGQTGASPVPALALFLHRRKAHGERLR